MNQQNALPINQAYRLVRLLRLAIIFASRRRDDTLPALRLRTEDEKLIITLPHQWIAEHPLRAENLHEEIQLQSYVHWPLMLEEQNNSRIG